MGIDSDARPADDESMSVPDSLDLQVRLQELADGVEHLLSEPLRPLSEHCRGYIEAISVDAEGNVWMTGWLQKSLGHEIGVIIVDRRKYVGAISLICYDRDDLPDGAHGMIGLIHSDWRPGPDVSDVFIFCTPTGTSFLRSVSPLGHLDDAAIIALFTLVQGDATHGDVMALRSLLLGANNWSPGTASAAGFSVQAAVDELLVLPGFGCLARGWVISPSKPVSDLSLRLGHRVLRPAPGSMAHHPRLDLASVYPEAPLLLDRAGFVVALEGVVSSEELINPILKVHFADGTSVNARIDPKVMRRIDHAVPTDDVRRLYPAIAKETFFARFAAALRADVISRLRQATVIIPCAPAPRWIIAAIPRCYSDARLLVDEIVFRSRTWTHAPGVLLLADLHHDRGRLPLLAEIVTSGTGLQCGLCLIEQIDKPLWALPHILAILGCSRFFFLMSNAFPDSTAWNAILAELDAKPVAPKALRMREGERLAGFVWQAHAFEAWSDGRMPIGVRHAEGFARAAGWLPGSALSICAPVPADRLLEEVDDICLTDAQQAGSHVHA